MPIRTLLTGVAASSGLAVGEVYQVRHVEIQVKEEGGTPDQERRLLDGAIDKAAGQLEALRAQLHGHKEQAKAAIFAAHSELLEDPDLIEIATSGDRQGKERRLRLEERRKVPCRAAGGSAQSTARAARQRSSGCGRTRAGGTYRRQARSSLLSRQRRSHRRRSHAVRYR